ncbi:MAG: methionyl-tRNA formyltransferase [Flavobacteriales bacterium]
MNDTHTAHRIVFLGTPRFAVGTLDALAHAGMNVVAVVTAPDRPAGRGLALRSPEVKVRALELGIPILQPERLKDPMFLEQLNGFQADVQVVVAFRMLPEVVWNAPPLGTINLHASLLPQYRGAAPINWAIINGEKETGITTFRLQHAIDTGDLLLQERMIIGENETAGELHDRMMTRGAELMVRTLEGVLNGTISGHAQEVTTPLKHAPKLTTAMACIDPRKECSSVHDLVRGLSPHPAAWCKWSMPGRDVQIMKVYRTRRTVLADKAEPGSVRVVDNGLLLRCADGWLELLELQPEGRKRMSGVELVRGMRSRENINVLGT